MIFGIRDICQVQTTVPDKVNKTKHLFEKNFEGFVRGGVENSKKKL